MFKNQLLPALSLVFMALFTTAPSQAEELTPIRSSEWAQPVGNQYNLYQMTPRLPRLSQQKRLRLQHRPGLPRLPRPRTSNRPVKPKPPCGLIPRAWTTS